MEEFLLHSYSYLSQDKPWSVVPALLTAAPSSLTDLFQSSGEDGAVTSYKWFGTNTSLMGLGSEPQTPACETPKLSSSPEGELVNELHRFSF